MWLVATVLDIIGLEFNKSKSPCIEIIVLTYSKFLGLEKSFKRQSIKH